MSGVGAVSLTDYVILSQVSMRGESVQREIQAAIMKQALDQKEQAGAAIVQMIEQTTASNGLGGRLDLRI